MKSFLGRQVCKLLVAITILSAISQARANSLDPCTPTERAQPSRLFCSDLRAKYSIVVETLMSKVGPACPQEKRVEYKTADVSIRDLRNVPVGHAQLFEGSFSYSLSPEGKGTFQSSAFKLKLKNCVSPLNGAFSVSF